MRLRPRLPRLSGEVRLYQPNAEHVYFYAAPSPATDSYLGEKLSRKASRGISRAARPMHLIPGSHWIHLAPKAIHQLFHRLRLSPNGLPNYPTFTEITMNSTTTVNRFELTTSQDGFCA